MSDLAIESIKQKEFKKGIGLDMYDSGATGISKNPGLSGIGQSSTTGKTNFFTSTPSTKTPLTVEDFGNWSDSDYDENGNFDMTKMNTLGHFQYNDQNNFFRKQGVGMGMDIAC